jgi:hypothetical protein
VNKSVCYEPDTQHHSFIRVLQNAAGKPPSPAISFGVSQRSQERILLTLKTLWGRSITAYPNRYLHPSKNGQFCEYKSTAEKSMLWFGWTPYLGRVDLRVTKVSNLSGDLTDENF